MARNERDRQPPKSRTLGVRVTQAEWRRINALARRRETSVDALLRAWAVQPLLELAREEGAEVTREEDVEGGAEEG